MRILNLYAGIGGNRKLWGDEHEITAVEIDSKIADVYRELYPQDDLRVFDAETYFLTYYHNFDLIWISPPCQSHSNLNYVYDSKKLPDLRLYGYIIFCKHHLKTNWVIENVKPYYKPMIPPSVILGRHMFWSNFKIPEQPFQHRFSMEKGSKNKMAKLFGMESALPLLTRMETVKARQTMRNICDPEIGKYILDCCLKNGRREQKKLFESG